MEDILRSARTLDELVGFARALSRKVDIAKLKDGTTVSEIASLVALPAPQALAGATIGRVNEEVAKKRRRERRSAMQVRSTFKRGAVFVLILVTVTALASCTASECRSTAERHTDSCPEGRRQN